MKDITLIKTPGLPRSHNVRAEFPIFDHKVAGQPLCYLDSAATAQKPRPVIEAVTHFMREQNATVHRGVYPLAAEATDLYEDARLEIADFLNVPKTEIVFTANATDSINLVAYSWAQQHVQRGDKIVLSEMEHHSNIVPWQQIVRQQGAQLLYAPIDEDGRLNLAAYASLLEQEPKLVAITHLSNVLGTINPVTDLVQMAHRAGAKVLIDGTQAVPHLGVDLKAIDADFYVFTGHKTYAPTGIGILHAKRELLEEMPPFLCGGEMIKKVDWFDSEWNDIPWKFEAGTPAVSSAIGLGVAVAWLKQFGMESVRDHELGLIDYALKQLSAVSGVKIYGPPAYDRGPVVAFTLENAHPHDIAEILGRSGICIRAGHHCAQPLMQRLGVTATARASFGLYNNERDVDRLVEGLAEVCKVLKL